ncbi:MAG: hypothetical protein RJA07_1316 [Bacteroidota bacterium]|jgi:iron complex outermembrane receptor protein
MLRIAYLILIVSIAMLATNRLLAQSNFNDSVFKLKQVNIVSNRGNIFSAGSKKYMMDSVQTNSHSHQSVADLLTDESSLFIKSYGQGSLATSSFRGGSANHTAILWNGFNISSPMNGQLDLSLVPVNLADEISIQYGGSSALWGSGAVSGTIHINNTAKFNQGFSGSINLSGGSFATYHQQASLTYSKKRFVSVIKLFNASAKNNFEYNNIFSADNNKIIQTNAELKNKGILSENYFLINDKQRINLLCWYQHTDRNIPPTMLQASNNSAQTDKHYRITSEWKYDNSRTTNFVRAAYFNEALIYKDRTYNYADSSRWQTFIAEAESKIKLNHQHLINIGINNTYVAALATTGYTAIKNNNRLAAFASYLYTTRNDKLKLNISIREELSNHKIVPFTYTLGGDYELTKWLSAKGNISKVYRIPTMNDLYWHPGGNPNLIAESGFSEEIGLKIVAKHKLFVFITQPTIFTKQIDNWIIWLPSISYWTPQNLMNVWSRGMETNSTLAIPIKKIKLSFSVLTNYVVSTNQTAKSLNDAAIDKQLIYVPMYSGNAKMKLDYKNVSVFYRHNYVGYRYTSTDNTEYLKPYQLGAIYCSYKINFNKTCVDMFIEVNNIWNESYQAILNRAMPARNFNAGFSFQFNQTNKYK